MLDMLRHLLNFMNDDRIIWLFVNIRHYYLFMQCNVNTHFSSRPSFESEWMGHSSHLSSTETSSNEICELALL